MFDCDPDAINNLEAVKGDLVEAAKRAQATIVDVVFHEFNPFGISGVVVIAESHLAIHTWPEYRYAAVDIFSCGDVLQRGIFLQAPPMPHKPTGARATGAKVSGAKVPVAKVPAARVPVARVPV